MGYAGIARAAVAAAPYVASMFANNNTASGGYSAGRAAVGGRNYDDVLNQAQSLGFDLNELANAAARRAQQDASFQQGMTERGQAFTRGIQADAMRQQQYNQMAINEQQNRFNAAQGLVDAYNQARQTNANLMANAYRASW